MSNATVVIEIVPNWERHLEEPIRQFFEHLGDTMVEESQAICPVKTGRLQDSIQYFLEGVALKTRMWFGATAPYALYVEMGHHTVAGTWVPAIPFIRPVAFKYSTRVS